jgi:hypothetical protein
VEAEAVAWAATGILLYSEKTVRQAGRYLTILL